MSEARSEVKVFLSTVSAEFGSYREALRHSLDRPNVTAKVQEDFIVTGTETLDMLDAYIRACDVVIHLVGDMTGAMAGAPSVAVIRQRYADFADKLPVADFLRPDGPPMSYTQWEAWLPLYHGKRLIIAAPAAGARRDPRYAPTPEQTAAQQAHLARLARVERFPGIHFRNADHFAAEAWRSGLLDVLIDAGLARRVNRLPFASLGELFVGREPDLDTIANYLGPAPSNPAQPVGCVALWGLGGIGKTRLALEYAWRRCGGHPTRLLVGADSRESLHRNLAALCAANALDLPEQHATEEARQHAAVIAWLNQHPGWLLILDNADDEAAAAAVEALRARLTGGHILVTTRLPNWSAAIHAQEVEVLSPTAAVDFLQRRTANHRAKQPDDDTQAARLAHELGYLALALEQAGAYIAKFHLSFDAYLDRWQHQRSKVLEWYNPRLMQYPKSVAITWQTSVDQLSPAARRLLQRLAWLAPTPIPASLLNVPIPGEDADQHEALEELQALSLARHADDTGGFAVHRLVQLVTRREQADAPDHTRLAEALRWVDDAFVGDADDVRNWPILAPLADHAVAVADHGATNGLTGPCDRLFNQVGVLLTAKAQYAEAEPLMRSALVIDEASFGPDHPKVAICLNNLAQQLQATNRIPEAEPLMHRALAIDKASFGPDHPKVAIRLNNLAQLLKATNRLPEAEPLMRRALAIDEASFGPDHPNVAIRLNNLAQLLQDTNRLAEAAPLMRRALTIDEASFGPDHPNVARDLNNLAGLFQDTNRLAEAEPLMRRALTIIVCSLGPDHPNSHIVGGNYIGLLHALGKPEAEIEATLRTVLK